MSGHPVDRSGIPRRDAAPLELGADPSIFIIFIATVSNVEKRAYLGQGGKQPWRRN
jgi:hypothetical protein